MILNDIEIRERVLNYSSYGMSRPLISPFDEKRLQGASYDLTITNEVIYIGNKHDVIDIRDQGAVDSQYKKAIVSSDGFVIAPNEYILVTLNETLYIPSQLTAHLRPKTRFTRLGIVVTGQHINPESICKLNIGLYNVTPNPIRLYPEISVAQVVFERMIAEPSEDKKYFTKKDANYSEDIDFVGAKMNDEFDRLVANELNRLFK